MPTYWLHFLRSGKRLAVLMRLARRSSGYDKVWRYGYTRVYVEE
jgi:hypothetical protein